MTLHEYPNVEQRSDEWYDLRRGLVTASAVGALISISAPGALEYDCPACDALAGDSCWALGRKTPTQIKTPHSRRAERAAESADDADPLLSVADNETSRRLIATLVAERITGTTEPVFLNDDMMRGVLHEPAARDRYAEHNGVTVDEVGFVVRDDWGFRLGASPDGLVGDDGGLEVKCPRAKTHIRTIAADVVPMAHMAQIQGCLLVTGRKWWDLVSFCAGLPLWTKRVYPDPAWHGVIVAAVAAFEEAAEQLTADYTAHAQGLPLTEAIPDDLVVV